ncbi:MAG TPA: hypothetical protein VKS79_08965 [Gemmataceae bacterium]|nr:hypothetical protein [Gemmataceae bacterium]
MPIRWHVCGIVLCRVAGAAAGIGSVTFYHDWLEQRGLEGALLGIAAAIIGFLLPAAIFRRVVPFHCCICAERTFHHNGLPFTGNQKPIDYLCRKCESSHCIDLGEAMALTLRE